MTRPLFAITTDFGPSSPYVAQIKGVLLSVVPDAQIVDVSHSIPARSIRHAEVVLRGTAFGMPLGTVHLVVVDPGVGTTRRPIAVTARGMSFVGPDNGVLGIAISQPGAKVCVLDRAEFFRQPVSPTFHGRDIFAPVAAELASGLPLDELGSCVFDALPTTLPACAQVSEKKVLGEVLVADDFGNLLTNVPTSSVKPDWQFRVGSQHAVWCTTYGYGPKDKLLILCGSDGFLEIAIRDGSAASMFSPAIATVVECFKE